MVNKLTIGYKDGPKVFHVCDEHLTHCVNRRLRSGYSTMSLTTANDRSVKCEYCEDSQTANEK